MANKFVLFPMYESNMSFNSRCDRRGMTSNPTIFQKAISESGEYDEQIQRMALSGKSIESSLSLHQHPGRVLQQLLDVHQELNRLTSIHDAMVIT